MMNDLLFQFYVASIPFQFFAGAWWLRGRRLARKQERQQARESVLRMRRAAQFFQLNAHAALPMVLALADQAPPNPVLQAMVLMGFILGLILLLAGTTPRD